jgi:tetratricopeptide (TPR) repeat protein
MEYPGGSHLMIFQETLPFFACLAIGAFVLDTVACRTDIGWSAGKEYVAAVEQYSSGDLAGSMRLAREIIRKDREFYPAQLLEGKILFFTDDLAGAKRVFATLARKEPRYTDARLWYIRTLIVSGDNATAQRELDRELSFNTSDWRFYYLYALLARATNESEKRIAMLNKAAVYLEESGKVYIDLAKTWHDLAQDDRALRFLEKAGSVAGNDGELFAGVEKLKVTILKGKD